MIAQCKTCIGISSPSIAAYLHPSAACCNAVWIKSFHPGSAIRTWRCEYDGIAVGILLPIPALLFLLRELEIHFASAFDEYSRWRRAHKCYRLLTKRIEAGVVLCPDCIRSIPEPFRLHAIEGSIDLFPGKYFLGFPIVDR